MRKSIILLAGIAASCSGSEDSYKKRISLSFRDPDSVEFQKFHIVNGVACGEVNAKNGFGAYDGYKPFVATLFDGDGKITPDFGPSDPISPDALPQRIKDDRGYCEYATKQQNAWVKQFPNDKPYHPMQCDMEMEDTKKASETKKFLDAYTPCTD